MLTSATQSLSKKKYLSEQLAPMTACYPTKRQTCKANRLILLVACNDGPIFVSLNWVLIKPRLCTFEVAHKVIFPTSSNASHQSFISNGLTTLCAIDRNRPTEQTSDNGDDKNNYQHFIFQFVSLDLFVAHSRLKANQLDVILTLSIIKNMKISRFHQESFRLF